MIKKLFLLTIIFLGIFQIWNVFAWSSKEFEDLNNKYSSEWWLTKEESNKLTKYHNEFGVGTEAVDKMKKQEQTNAAKVAENDKLNNELDEKSKERDKKCDPKQWWSWDCIDKDTFMFNPSSGFWIWPSFDWNSTSEWVNNVFGTVIQKLMVALWALSVLIMTVWGWYIILYHGQDELLSKGKSIFMSGVIALIVALSSYMIVGLLRFILYNT